MGPSAGRRAGRRAEPRPPPGHDGRARSPSLRKPSSTRLVAGAFDGALWTALSWLLLAVGLAGTAYKLFQWVLCARDTRPTTIDPNGITITLKGHDAVFPWSQMATVYFLEHRFGQWLVCTPGSNSALGRDHLTARFWSRPHSVFFLTSVSGFGDQLVRESLESYAGDRYQH